MFNDWLKIDVDIRWVTEQPLRCHGAFAYQHCFVQDHQIRNLKYGALSCEWCTPRD